MPKSAKNNTAKDEKTVPEQKEETKNVGSKTEDITDDVFSSNDNNQEKDSIYEDISTNDLENTADNSDKDETQDLDFDKTEEVHQNTEDKTSEISASSIIAVCDENEKSDAKDTSDKTPTEPIMDKDQIPDSFPFVILDANDETESFERVELFIADLVYNDVSSTQNENENQKSQNRLICQADIFHHVRLMYRKRSLYHGTRKKMRVELQ